MPIELNDKVALITGGAQGIGKGIAMAMAREGANIALFDIVNAAEGTVEDIESLGQKAVSFRVDVSDGRQVDQAMCQVLKQFEKVDILVNNAGLLTAMPFLDIPDDVRDNVMGVNFNGVWNCTKAVIPGMINQKYGKIINMSSVTGPIVSKRGATIYSASKSAVSGFTRALALEVAEYGINVNAICPGRVDTLGAREKRRKMDIDPDEWVRKLSKTIPLGRMGSVDDIGNLAVFLASEESAFITGAEIVIDGGDNIREEKMRWQDIK